jgi:hypothetical protein
MEEKVFLQLREITIEFPDGSVFGIGRLQHVEKGWVVRIKNACDFEGETGMLQALALAKETTGTVSGSKDGDVELWDVVEIFEDEETATKAGKKNGQMTIYQIETARLKWLE